VDLENMGPGVGNLLAIHQAFSGWSDEQMRTHFTGMRYGDLKKTVAEVVVESLRPIQKRFNEIMSEVGYLDSVLKQGMERVLPIAQDTVNLVKERMGLYTST